LAQEVVRRIESKEIDPKNEAIGVKLGSYRVVDPTAKGRYCC